MVTPLRMQKQKRGRSAELGRPVPALPRVGHEAEEIFSQMASGPREVSSALLPDRAVSTQIAGSASPRRLPQKLSAGPPDRATLNGQPTGHRARFQSVSRDPIRARASEWSDLDEGRRGDARPACPVGVPSGRVGNVIGMDWNALFHRQYQACTP